MEIFKSFKLFGLYFYISNVRMKRRRTIDEQLRNRRNALLRKKRFLYQLRGGCCELCGKHFVQEALEIHHLVPVSQNPGLALQTKNLILLCHDCHVKVHQGNESAVLMRLPCFFSSLRQNAAFFHYICTLYNRTPSCNTSLRT